MTTLTTKHKLGKSIIPALVLVVKIKLMEVILFIKNILTIQRNHDTIVSKVVKN